MAAFDRDGNLIEGTEGKVLKLTEKFSYWGDGDGTYYLYALVQTENGFETIACGEAVWNADGSAPKYYGSAVDAAHLLPAYETWYAEQREAKAKTAYNTHGAYELRVGATAYVEKGTRKRQHAGKFGTVIWIGTDSFGNAKCGIKQESGDVAWVAAYQVAVVPDYGDFEATA